MYERTITSDTQDAASSKKLAPFIDLRSDTVTKPTPAMRRAMAEAEVGDDGYGEDPTVNRLEARAAEIFEREAALFVPSGSMGNLISIRTWTRPGHEVIAETRAHINMHEMASMSVVAGCFPRMIYAADGILTWEGIEAHIRPKSAMLAQTGLISIENSHNMAGGTVYSAAAVAEICDRAHAVGIPVHFDGARIFNAAVATGSSVAELSRKADSIMFCLSKGLAAPAGSLVIGSGEFIGKARTARKLLGGGMRQIGGLAAAGLIALEESPERLHIDHENARFLAEGIARIPGFAIDPKKVVTNIVIWDVKGTGKTAAEISAALAKRRILANATEKFSLRMVAHCDVDRAAFETALQALAEIAAA
jgi:threonine aldolase